MSARKLITGGARKRPCPVAELAARLEELSARHQLADSDKEVGRANPGDLEAYDEERDAIAIRASYLTPTSATGAALQIALAASDADCLIGSTFVDQVVADRMKQRMDRNLRAAVRYLESIGAQLGPTVRDYNIPERSAA
jgi:hypothetical protein